MLLNNLCEVFNSKLIEGRDKPIISCLEFIRQYMMKRICSVIKVQAKCQGPLTPNATKILEHNKTSAAQYIARFNGGDKYQVEGPWQDQHVVDMGQRECSCRKWELTGIPCKHVIAVLFDRADNGEHVGELHTYVHRVHWLETWKQAYSHKVEPIKGRLLWPVSQCPTKVTPPAHRNQPGRPKKKRRLTIEERLEKKRKNATHQGGAGSSQQGGAGSSQQGGAASSQHGGAVQSQHGGAGSSQQVGAGESQQGGSAAAVGIGKLSRKYVQVTCSKCKQKGHNKRSCKSAGGN